MASNFSIGVSVDTQKAEANIKQAAESFKKLDKSVDSANKQLGSFDSITEKVVVNAKKQYRSLVKQINDVSLTLAAMSQAERQSAAGQALQQKLQAMEKEAAKFADAIADNQQKIKNLASDTQVTDGLGMLARTFGDVTTAVNVLGGDSENLKKILYDVAKIQATVRAVESLTKAFQKQNLVLLKNPYVLVATAIAALSVAVYEYTQQADKSTKSTTDYKIAIEKLGDAAEIAKYSISDLTQRAVNNAKIQDAVNEFNRLGNEIAKLEKRRSDIDGGNEWYDGQLYYAYDLQQKLTKEIEKQKASQQFQQNLIKKYQGENELIEKSYEKQAEDTNKNSNNLKSNLKTVTEYASKLSDPKLFKLPEIKPVEQKAEVKTDIKTFSPLGIITSTVQNEFLQRATQLGEDGQKAFWEAVANGDSWETALKRANGQLDEQVGKLNNVGQAANLAASAFNSLGGSFEQPVLNIVGTLAQAIATISLSFAQSMAKSGKLGIWDWIAGAVAGVATLATIIAQMKSLNNFADGGIIQGATSIGDFNLARVNAGEMILNNRQQQNLWDIFQGKNSINAANNEKQSVEFKLRGQELIGLIKNTNKKMSKI